MSKETITVTRHRDGFKLLLSVADVLGIMTDWSESPIANFVALREVRSDPIRVTESRATLLQLLGLNNSNSETIGAIAVRIREPGSRSRSALPEAPRNEVTA